MSKFVLAYPPPSICIKFLVKQKLNVDHLTLLLYCYMVHIQNRRSNLSITFIRNQIHEFNQIILLNITINKTQVASVQLGKTLELNL